MASEEIIIGSSSQKDGKKDYFKRKKTRARKNLQNYPNFQKSLGDFSYLNYKNQNKNAFFNIASSEDSEALLINFEM